MTTLPLFTLYNFAAQIIDEVDVFLADEPRVTLEFNTLIRERVKIPADTQSFLEHAPFHLTNETQLYCIP